MGAILCCLRCGPDDDGSCLCLPWPFLNNNHDSGAAAAGQTSAPIAAGSEQEDTMNTFRCPPRPLPCDDPQFIRQMEQRPLVEESNNADINKGDGSSLTKAQSQGQKTIGGTHVDVSSEDDCPICLEEYDYENPKVELQCNHDFHLGCIYEWMERSQSCPLCAKVMLFNEDQ